MEYICVYTVYTNFLQQASLFVISVNLASFTKYKELCLIYVFGHLSL